MANKTVLLAHSWDPSIDVVGWHMSEKLDGVRAYWDGRKLVSRNGLVFAAPDWFLDGLPEGAHLDGELFLGRGLFPEASGIVRRHDKGPGWKRLAFMLFDAPNVAGPFEKRLAWLGRAKLPKHAPVLPHLECKSPAHLGRYLAEVEKRGGEGVMLRQPGSLYERKRSHTLLKVKTFVDAEAKVVGYQEGEGKHRGSVGALLCEALAHKSPKATIKAGTKFKVGTGLSDEERDDPPRIGSIITFRCQEVSAAGVPRFPSFVAARDYEGRVRR